MTSLDRMTGDTFVRTATVAALLVVSVVAIVTVREVAIGRREVDAADADAAKSDWPDAIAHARAAAQAFVPGSPWPERGYTRLQAIGHDAEARGDDENALLAYGAMRTAALSTRAIGSGGDHWCANAEEGLARVASSLHRVGVSQISHDGMLEALRRTERPASWTLATLSAAVIAMVVGLARLAFAQGGSRGAGTVLAVGFVAYVIAMLVRC